MCFTYEVLETFCSLLILAPKAKKAFTAPRTTRTGPTPHCHPVPSCGATSVSSRSAAGDTCTPKSRVVAASAPSVSIAPDPHRPTALHPCRTTLPSPAPSHSAAPDPLCPAPLWSYPESQKQKIGPNCNFFAIADYRKAPQSPIEARKCSENSSFMLYGDRERSAIAKKLQKSRKFCFCNAPIVEAETNPFKRLNARTGQISRWGESRKRRAEPAAKREVAGILQLETRADSNDRYNTIYSRNDLLRNTNTQESPARAEMPSPPSHRNKNGSFLSYKPQ